MQNIVLPYRLNTPIGEKYRDRKEKRRKQQGALFCTGVINILGSLIRCLLIMRFELHSHSIVSCLLEDWSLIPLYFLPVF